MDGYISIGTTRGSIILLERSGTYINKIPLPKYELAAPKRNILLHAESNTGYFLHNICNSYAPITIHLLNTLDYFVSVTI